MEPTYFETQQSAFQQLHMDLLFVCLLPTLCQLSRLCDAEMRKYRMFKKTESGSGVLTGYVMHQQFHIQQLYVLPTLYLCVLCLSENKQRLAPLTA